METKQLLRVRGWVKDAHSGQPIKGVKVTTDSDFKGKETTDAGKFTIQIKSKSDEPTLKFSFPGYKSIKRSISIANPKKEINISLFKNTEFKDLDDHTLIRRALDGSQKAFAVLMKRYKDSVYYVVLKMVNKPEDAEDLTIEAFGKAFNKLDKFSPDYAFSTWLFRIAINNSIDFIRKKRLQTLSIDNPISNEDGDTMSPHIVSDVLDPEERFIKDQRKKIMRDITEKLTPKYRQLIELRFFEELSYLEIADEMSLPIGTVKAQLFRAKQLLHNILKNGRHF